MGLRTYVMGTRAWVVPAIKVTVEAVALWIIEPASRLAVLARGHRIAGEQKGCPGAVVCLEP